MQIIKQFGWVYYVGETADQLDEHKCGKWMYFYGDIEFAEKICKAAVENGVVAESKHSDAPEDPQISDREQLCGLCHPTAKQSVFRYVDRNLHNGTEEE